MNSLRGLAQSLYHDFGPHKPMGEGSKLITEPHYFLCRKFLGELDVAIILNTKRCRYQCSFCQLPAKSLHQEVPSDAIIAQVAYLLQELRHFLPLLQRVTMGNEGSILDSATMSTHTLREILEALSALRRLRRVVLETRLEFAIGPVLEICKSSLGRCRLDILAGFETLDETIREEILGKKESINAFLLGLDTLASNDVDVSAYVLFKPDPVMTDEGAVIEAKRTIDFLISETRKRKMHLTLRINPMYAAAGSKWLRLAQATEMYSPPKFTDVLQLATSTREKGIPTYVGLSTEGLETSGYDYRARRDFSQRLLLQAREINENSVI